MLLSKSEFHTGDEIVFRENSRYGKVWASKDTIAKVLKCTKKHVHIFLPDGREMRIKPNRIRLRHPPNIFMRLMDAIKKRVLRRLTGPLSAEEVEWVVNDIGELGVRIYGRSYYLYKGKSLVYRGTHDDGSPMRERPVAKREFGEVCRPLHKTNFKPHEPQMKWYTEGDGWRRLRTARAA
ncbi:hypothetical protein ACFLY5_00755 [Patescibacteria group bacterium]